MIEASLPKYSDIISGQDNASLSLASHGLNVNLLLRFKAIAGVNEHCWPQKVKATRSCGNGAFASGKTWRLFSYKSCQLASPFKKLGCFFVTAFVSLFNKTTDLLEGKKGTGVPA